MESHQSRVLIEPVGARQAQRGLLTIPNQLGVDYNAHVLESILKYIAPEGGWR